jgi:hypothetical protein
MPNAVNTPPTTTQMIAPASSLSPRLKAAMPPKDAAIPISVTKPRIRWTTTLPSTPRGRAMMCVDSSSTGMHSPCPSPGRRFLVCGP